MNFEIHPQAFQAPIPKRDKISPWVMALAIAAFIMAGAAIAYFVLNTVIEESFRIAFIR